MRASRLLLTALLLLLPQRLRGRVASAALVAACLVLAQACKPDKPRPDLAEPTPAVKTQLPVPAFSADSAYAHVAAQVGFGPRVPESDAHAQTRSYIQRTLERYGAEVTVQPFDARLFDGREVEGYNLIGSFRPEATRRIFLSAHYDTRPFADSELADTTRRDEPIDGADDGASGVGVLLELARQIGANPIGVEDFGVDLVFFDLEDYGKPNGETQADMYTWALGSQYWARHHFRPGYAPEFGVLLDMVGAEGAVFGREQFSKRYAPGVQNAVWRLAQAMGRGERFVDADIGFATDDHYFVNEIAGWPTIDIIYKPIDGSAGFGRHWHTHDDDLGVIDRGTLGDVGQVVTAVVYRAAGNML